MAFQEGKLVSSLVLIGKASWLLARLKHPAKADFESDLRDVSSRVEKMCESLKELDERDHENTVNRDYLMGMAHTPVFGVHMVTPDEIFELDDNIRREYKRLGIFAKEKEGDGKEKIEIFWDVFDSIPPHFGLPDDYLRDTPRTLYDVKKVGEDIARRLESWGFGSLLCQRNARKVKEIEEDIREGYIEGTTIALLNAYQTPESLSVLTISCCRCKGFGIECCNPHPM